MVFMPSKCCPRCYKTGLFAVGLSFCLELAGGRKFSTRAKPNQSCTTAVFFFFFFSCRRLQKTEAHSSCAADGPFFIERDRTMGVRVSHLICELCICRAPQASERVGRSVWIWLPYGSRCGPETETFSRSPRTQPVIR